MTSWWLCDQFS